MGRRVAGVFIERIADIDRLVRAQLDGWGGWSHRHDYTGADGLERALRDAGPWRTHFSEVLLTCLAEEAYRTDVIGLLPVFEADLTVEDLLALVARPDVGDTHRMGLMYALSRVAPARHIGATRALVDALRSGQPAAVALARVDPQALLAEASHVPHRWCGGVLLNVPVEVGHAFLLAKAPWPAALHAEIVARETLWGRVDPQLLAVFRGLPIG